MYFSKATFFSLVAAFGLVKAQTFTGQGLQPLILD
jgi:hypothetical protein